VDEIGCSKAKTMVGQLFAGYICVALEICLLLHQNLLFKLGKQNDFNINL
jgi:hypothetical protein